MRRQIGCAGHASMNAAERRLRNLQRTAVLLETEGQQVSHWSETLVRKGVSGNSLRTPRHNLLNLYRAS